MAPDGFFFFKTWENKTILIVWENTGEDAFSCSIPYTQSQVLAPLTVVVSDAEPSSCPSLAPCFSFTSVLCQLPNAVLHQGSIPCLLALPLLFFFFFPPPPSPVLLRNFCFWLSVRDVLVNSNIVCSLCLYHSCSWSRHLMAENRKIS